MSEAEIIQWWTLWFSIVAIIVVAAAVLLITIVILARRIATLAGRALELAETIEVNTQAIWRLSETNETAEDIAHEGSTLLRHAGAIVDALSEADRHRAA